MVLVLFSTMKYIEMHVKMTIEKDSAAGLVKICCSCNMLIVHVFVLFYFLSCKHEKNVKM